ncbi:Hypothetical predicted protein [Lecanosticta acicola]|uniref:ABM domain-containing protein n=1 Tax=Lecanosticta acicola TaxID=111012 RepID=A0AAI9EE66_9PEZI|nr:Hypothetical predicted protein [Lecanosticta acicola]
MSTAPIDTSNGIALLCTLHPASLEKQERVLSLLRKSAREYYRLPSATCTTWSYFTPLPKGLGVAGLEIYTEVSALQKQVDDPVHFQKYHEIVKKEGLYSKDEELVAWYLTAGFVARVNAGNNGGGNLVSLTKFIGKKEGVLKALESFLPFVENKEPFVLTYAIFTRPKAPKEVLLFVRYKDSNAMKSHSKAPEHVAVVKEIMKHAENDIGKSTSVWQEVEDSFVSNQIGGHQTAPKL